MSYSILRVARVKGSSNTKGMQRHNQRENKNYNNKDIDPAQTYKNYDLINNKNIDYQEKIDETITVNYSGKRKIRSDAIRHVDGLITSDEAFFRNLDEDETQRFFKDSLEFLQDGYGKENMLYATVHLDEKVPHMHFGFVPLTEDGRLSAKEKLGNKKSMTELQDRFNKYVNEKGYEMERGTSKVLTEKQHRQMDQYKKDTTYHKKGYEMAKDEHEQVEEKMSRLKEKLSNDIERLNKTDSFTFEDEKQVEKNFFGKVLNEQATGRKIISAEDYSRLTDRLLSATRILNDYETLANQNMYKENQKLKEEKEDTRDKMLLWKEEYQKSRHGVKKLRNENEELKDKNRNLENEVEEKDKAIDGLLNHSCTIYKTLRRRFKGFEEAYEGFSNTLAQKERTKPVSRVMDNIQQTVHAQDKKRSRSHDLEL